jgi:hypothetical protein
MATERRGEVYIGPSAHFEPDGRMVDPETSLFYASWQDNRVLEDEDDIRGAEAAIEWGRERSDYVIIRLGHRGDTFFSAGTKHRRRTPMTRMTSLCRSGPHRVRHLKVGSFPTTNETDPPPMSLSP